MSQKPIAMEQLKQILQLKSDGISIREMARRTGISRNSVRKYLSLLAFGRLPGRKEEPDNKTLAEAAYGNDSREHDCHRLQQLINHFHTAQTELSKTGVTRQLLWREYMEAHPDGYVYSHYCYHFHEYLKNRDLSMHLEYKAGDMIMIDFAGKKRHYVDMSTGEMIKCHVFVSVFPFSGLIFCYAVHSQKTADFTTCINAMLRFYGGVPATILCDNLKTAVNKSDPYEPDFTEICHQLSEHYNTTFSATRAYSPQDKAMVEGAVNIVYNHIYGPLRNHEFNSLQSLNAAMHERLITLNNKSYKKSPYSRWFFFEQQERGTLKSLATAPFNVKRVSILTVQRNYHVQLSDNRHYYSVPYKYVGKKVKVLYDARVVEIYLDHERIAIHPRTSHQTAYITLDEHMPPNHRRMKEIKGFNRDDLLQMAGRIGTATHQAATLILQNSIYIEQNYKACFGMLMLQKKYNSTRLEAACARALLGTRVKYTMIKNILEHGLDRQLPLPTPPTLPDHDNIRGKDNYQ